MKKMIGLLMLVFFVLSLTSVFAQETGELPAEWYFTYEAKLITVTGGIAETDNESEHVLSATQHQGQLCVTYGNIFQAPTLGLYCGAEPVPGADRVVYAVEYQNRLLAVFDEIEITGEPRHRVRRMAFVDPLTGEQESYEPDLGQTEPGALIANGGFLAVLVSYPDSIMPTNMAVIYDEEVRQISSSWYSHSTMVLINDGTLVWPDPNGLIMQNGAMVHQILTGTEVPKELFYCEELGTLLFSAETEDGSMDIFRWSLRAEQVERLTYSSANDQGAFCYGGEIYFFSDRDYPGGSFTGPYYALYRLEESGATQVSEVLVETTNPTGAGFYNILLPSP